MRKQPVSEILASNVRLLMDMHSTIDTQSRLAVKARLGQSTISRILRAETGATIQSVEAIAATYKVGPAQLLSPNLGVTNPAETRIKNRYVPLISYVQAGAWTEVAGSFDVNDAQEWLLPDVDLSDDAFALEIRGDSMLPDFHPGDRVIIDPDIQPNPGDFVVAANNEHEATFKKYRPRGQNEKGQSVIELVPLNPDFPSMRSDILPLRIIGTMVEHRCYRKRYT